MNTCIIGGGGFIGTWVVKKLLETGRNITVIGRKPTTAFESPVKYLVNKTNDKLFFNEAFDGIDEVIELAYSTTPQTSFENPVKDIIDNLAVSVNIFESLIEKKIKKVVYVSSGGTIYGHATDLPINEEHHTNPVSPYGITKLATEKYGLMFHLTNMLPVIIVRPGNAYGIGQLPYLGQGFVSTAIASLVNNKAISIFGKEGTIRDYIYVEDVAEGIIAALGHGEAGQCYNIGTGIGTSNMEIIEAIKQRLDLRDESININIKSARSFDVQANILDSGKLTKISGWKPAVSLRDGLNKTITWISQLQKTNG